MQTKTKFFNKCKYLYIVGLITICDQTEYRRNTNVADVWVRRWKQFLYFCTQIDVWKKNCKSQNRILFEYYVISLFSDKSVNNFNVGISVLLELVLNKFRKIFTGLKTYIFYLNFSKDKKRKFVLHSLQSG